MKDKIILEIGKNHLGSKKLLFKYLKNFNFEEVYGFTIQLREDKYYRGKKKKFKLENSTILKFREMCKLNKKKFGLSIQNEDNLKIIDLVKPDFIKVLSYSTHNIKFCSQIRNNYTIPIYFSLGLVEKNKSLVFLKKFFKHVSMKNTHIIYTKIDKLIFDFSLSELYSLSNKMKHIIAYGHHIESTCFPAIMGLFNINTFFLYVKDKDNKKYRDNNNAYTTKEFKIFYNLLLLIKKLK